MIYSHQNNFFNNFEEVERLLLFNSANQIKPGLERIKFLLKNLNNPQNSFPSIHIVGTNGKGSTAAFIESVFRTSGYKTGFYSSPHLENPGERLLINSKELNSKDWLRAVKITVNALDNKNCNINNESFDKTSYFELLTASAFLLAEENNIDIGIIEAGLGGRLDATNLLERVKCSVITSISMDHMEYLGDTLEKIASEKFDVIRKNTPAVFSGNEKSLVNLFRKFCNEKNSYGYVLNEDAEIKNIEISLNGNTFDFYSENLNLKNVHTNLIGSFQVKNAALALLAISKIKNSFPKINNESILSGIKNTFWKGRLEIISKNPWVIIDGGHNPDGVRNLVESIKTLFHNKKIGIVYAVMKDKDYISCLKILNELHPSLYTTCVPEMKRSLSPQELLNSAENFKWENKISCFENPLDAVEKSKLENDLTIICGSLYLIGMLRSKL